jgi:putative transposase
MRYPASEKLEIIRLVEQSHQPVKRTLEQIGVSRPTFYRWYDVYRRFGEAALEDRRGGSGRVWNRIPNELREQVLEMALDLLRLGSQCLQAFEGARPDHEPGLHRDESC